MCAKEILVVAETDGDAVGRGLDFLDALIEQMFAEPRIVRMDAAERDNRERDLRGWKMEPMVEKDH